jgi:cytochrome P450
MRAGQRVLLQPGLANRDPEQFPAPERLDLRRATGKHLAFGAGIHYCPGAGLARMILRVALSVLFSRTDGLRLDGEPVWAGDERERGLVRLPVAFEPSRP